MEESEEENEGGGGGFRLDLMQSYLGFAKRALRTRWILAVSVFTVGLVLTLLLAKFLPRTYSCTTVMMVQASVVLDGRDGTNALAGADEMISRHENLEALIRETGLLKTAAERRPPLLKLKDNIVSALFGQMDEKTKMAALVGTLESKIDVTADKGDLTVKVQWSDPATATELAEAARESFLKSRHSAEISAFEDKMAILDGHAAKLRDDIGAQVQQLKAVKDQQLAQRKPAGGADSAAAAAPVAAAPRVTRHVAAEPDAQLPALKEKLADLKAKVAALDADRERRVREEQAKYDDLKLRLTNSHPSVITQKERIAIVSQVPSDETLMQAEIKDIEGEIQQRNAMASSGTDVVTGGGGGAKRPGPDATLPPEVTDLLERDNLDPALSAQLSGAVTQYGSLRTEIFNTRVDLDTAQAAFNHRYQVIVPAEMPTKADKPKMPAIIGGGLVFALILSLLLPILAELRTDIIRDRWQVEHIQLPVLAELRLPQHSSD